MADSKASSKLDAQLKDAGKSLAPPPSDVKALYTVLDESEILLSKVNQSPSSDIYIGLKSIMESIISNDLMEHPDVDIRVAVAACISEITRITAPDPSYRDETMKVIFALIVETFQGLDDISARSYSKRVLILETLAKVKSCTVMLDLECNQLILDMFHCFFKKIRKDHEEKVFSAMEMIMIVALEESEDISVELLGCLLASVKKHDLNVDPIARNLGKRVIRKTHRKLQPYMVEFFELSGYRHSHYSKIIARICQVAPSSAFVAAVVEEEVAGEGKGRGMIIEVEVVSPRTSERLKIKIAAKKETIKKSQQAISFRPKRVVRRKSRRIPKISKSLPPGVRLKDLDERLIGTKVRMYWPFDDVFYPGVVDSYCPSTKKHSISYDDGDIEVLLLKDERWEVIVKEPDSGKEEAVTFPIPAILPMKRKAQELGNESSSQFKKVKLVIGSPTYKPDTEGRKSDKNVTPDPAIQSEKTAPVNGNKGVDASVEATGKSGGKPEEDTEDVAGRVKEVAVEDTEDAEVRAKGAVVEEDTEDVGGKNGGKSYKEDSGPEEV